MQNIKLDDSHCWPVPLQETHKDLAQSPWGLWVLVHTRFCLSGWTDWLMVYCCCCSVTKLCPILCDPWTSACQASLSSIISWNLLKFISIELLMLSNHLILCTSFSFFLQSFPVSVFSNELALRTRSPKYWSFSFSNSSSNEYSGLISFRINWPDLLEVQGTLKSLLQHHNLNASILQWSALFMVHLSYPYMTTGKNTTLTIQTFVSKMMSLLFNTLS